MEISQQDAKKIATKLKADIQPGSKHKIVSVKYDDKVVARYGIRHANKGHGHVPSQLYVSMTEAKNLAKCTLDKDSYFKILKGKGLIK